jgi:diguanylate cyclase (GGDEF)-like protein/PAS domain S-box-containing protein
MGLKRLFLHGLLLLCAVLGVWQPSAWADEAVRIAVLAYRPKVQTMAQWRPLAVALKKAIPERDFLIQVYDQTELEAAVASRQVDFVLTNPGHYVVLTRRVGLQAALATLLLEENGQETSAFGGVIFARADSKSIAALRDIDGKSIAAVGQESLGGYQVQAFELMHAGVDVTRDNKVSFTGQPHDKVVQAVLEGQSDVGFVRTGLLEAMAREGKLDLEKVKVINTQSLSSFPVKTSTALYPEWPFSYLAHVDERLARQVSAALYMLHQDKALMSSMGIRGFSVPADYTPVADMLRKLRLPPFDATPVFTFRDVLRQYRWQVVLASLAMALILLLGARLILATRRLRAERNTVLAQQKALLESEFRWKLAVRASGGGMWDWDVAARKLYLSDLWKTVLGYALDELSDSPDEWENRVHPDDRAAALDALNACLEGRSDFYQRENRLRCKDGNYKWLLERGQVVSRDASGAPLRMIGIDADITDRKNADQQLQLAASVFSSAREGITITDPAGTILDVNEAFTHITGFSREEVLGKNPRTLHSGHQDAGFYDAMYAELKTRDHWFGELWNRRKSGELYAEMLTISAVRDPLGRLTHYVAMFFDITTIKEHQAQLERIAHFDALTNLPNRVLLADRLKQAMAQAQRRSQLLAVAYLDLDGFKEVNDTHGHDVGDQLLIAIAGAMKQAMREVDTLARIGGDEFVAVLADLSSAEDCDNTLRRMLVAAARPFRLGELTLQVSASLGVTFYPQLEVVDADQLMRQADQAMYQAKLAGKNRYHVFDAAQDRNMRGLHESIGDLARAVVQQEFVLFYQPKVNLRSGQVVGMEALIRWQHPDKGLLNPGQFLPVIEDHALSVALGDWVIEAALGQVAAWLSQGLALEVSVNVGARQLQQEDFVDKLRESLARYPSVSPRLLTMEVLETSALEDLGHTSKVIEACAKIGVDFALDDFGTGYSSLTYLKHLPVTIIKIDQSFVSGLLNDSEDLAILEGVVGLAHAFKRQVIAEGMETPAHGRRLLALGCELAQGYGIARPMPASEVPGWLDQWQPDASWTPSQMMALP